MFTGPRGHCGLVYRKHCVIGTVSEQSGWSDQSGEGGGKEDTDPDDLDPDELDISLSFSAAAGDQSLSDVGTSMKIRYCDANIQEKEIIEMWFVVCLFVCLFAVGGGGRVALLQLQLLSN
jgi:hypothetical protein